VLLDPQAITLTATLDEIRTEALGAGPARSN
jgi:hypothetical protein